MSSSGSPVEFAAWTDPGASLRVEYSLPLFHEIDFFVNEGYRRIPHGGIELGGLLFGHASPGAIRIESFRPIECEHASGPSFKLSERDIEALRKQIEIGEPGMEVLGWFVAHTRSELQMNEIEAGLFDELLPGQHKLMLLVKPEKFKSTRFSFLVRGLDGSIDRDGRDRAFVLPLPGRAGRADTRPAVLTQPLVQAEPPVPVEPVATEPVALPAPPAKPEIPVVPQPIAIPEPIIERPREIRRPLANDVPPVPETPPDVIESPPVRELPRTFAVPPPAPIPVAPPQQQFSETESRIERRRSAREMQRGRNGSKLGFALILLLAGILGCGIGYWTYLQLPSSVIPLNLQPEANGFTLSWPPALTRDAVYVAVRVNDGQPVLVSTDDRNSGHSEINAAGQNVKVELIARRWMRDSRGIVRYVR